jgi:biopolymer transport protein TolR
MALSSGSDFDDGLVATINVTPLVDVMLVLLVIFMVTAPMMQQGVEIDLPKASAAPLELPEDPLVVTVDQDGRLSISGSSQIPLEELGGKVKAVLAERADRSGKVFVKADRRLSYGEVMKVISQLYQSDITGVGLVSDNP